MRERDDEREQERKVREAATRRRQAESVAAVVHVEPESRPDPDSRIVPKASNAKFAYMGHIERYERYRYGGWVNVFNQSSMPIYEVRVPVEWVDGEVLVRTEPLVAPGQTGHLHLVWQDDRSRHGQGSELVFRDAAGVTWHRLATGELHECAADLWLGEPDGDNNE